MDAVLGALMGTGLAIAAGVRAFLPMAALGLAGRFLPGFELPEAWRWLENDWVIVTLLVLLGLDLIADKVPWLDSVNDVVQTVIRPTAGGIAFGASSAATTALVEDPARIVETDQWLPIAIGVVLALGTHLLKLAGRGLLNIATGGAGAPVASVAEDGAAVSLSLSAILFPAAVVLILAAVAVGAVIAIRRLRARRRAAAAGPGEGPET